MGGNAIFRTKTKKEKKLVWKITRFQFLSVVIWFRSGLQFSPNFQKDYF